MKEVGALKELGVKAGDVVEFSHPYDGKIRYTVAFKSGQIVSVETGEQLGDALPWTVISRATPKLWRDMTPEEKGALLLAAHEGRDLEYWRRGSGGWASCSSAGIYDNEAYRIKPEPKVEVVTVYGGPNKGNNRLWGLSVSHLSPDTHQITFNLIDGKPDCDSVKMECIE